MGTDRNRFSLLQGIFERASTSNSQDEWMARLTVKQGVLWREKVRPLCPGGDSLWPFVRHALAPATLHLLRVPLHLDVFLRAIETPGGDSLAPAALGDARVAHSLQGLYELLWKRIVTTPAAPASASVAHRVEVVHRLVKWMEDNQRTTAPKSLFERVESEHLLPAAQFLAHEGLLRETGRFWEFLHQTF